MEISLIDNNTDYIHNKEFFTGFEDQISCIICFGFLINPQECMTCQTNYCNKCLTDWLSRKNGCSNRCTESTFRKSSKGIRSILEKLEISCPLCGEIIPYEKYEDHINQRNCMDTLVKCPNENCNQNFTKKSIEKHISLCEYQKVHCEECGNETIRKNLLGTINSLQLELENVKLMLEILKNENTNLKNENQSLLSSQSFVTEELIQSLTIKDTSRSTTIIDREISGINQNSNNIEFLNFEFSGPYIFNSTTAGTNNLKDLKDRSLNKGICAKGPAWIIIELIKQTEFEEIEIGGWNGNSTLWYCENGYNAEISTSINKTSWELIGVIPSGFGNKILNVKVKKSTAKYIKFSHYTYMGIGFLNIKECQPENIFKNFLFNSPYINQFKTAGTNRVEDLNDRSLTKGICANSPGVIQIEFNKLVEFEEIHIGGWNGNSNLWFVGNGANARIDTSKDGINWYFVGVIPSNYGANIINLRLLRSKAYYIKFSHTNFLGIGHLHINTLEPSPYDLVGFELNQRHPNTGTNNVEDLSDKSQMKGICASSPAWIIIILRSEVEFEQIEVGGWKGNSNLWYSGNGAGAFIETSKDKNSWVQVGKIHNDFWNIKMIQLKKSIAKYIRFRQNARVGIGYLRIIPLLNI